MLPFFALTNFSMAILVIAMPSIAVSYGSPIYYSLLNVAYFIGIFIGSFLVSVLKKNGITIAVSWLAMGGNLCVFHCARDVNEAADSFVIRRFYRHHQCTVDVFDSNYYTAAVTGTCCRLS